MSVALAGLLLAAGSAVAYSGLDLARKLLMARMRASPLLFYQAVGVLPAFVLWMTLAGGWRPEASYFLPGGGSILINIVANLLFLVAVRMSPLSLTIPFLSLTPVFAAVLAMPLLGEIPSARQWVGIVIVVVAAFRINLEGGEGLSIGAAWRSLAREKGSLLMVGVALLWSLAAPLDKLAMAASSPQWHGFALNAGIGVGCGVLLVAQGRLGELKVERGNIVLLTLSVIGSLIALVLLLLALTYSWVGVVESVKRGLGAAMAVLLGRAFFTEPVNAHKLWAVAMMGVGMALILL